MKVRFAKYQATGNDFILIDNRTANLKLNTGQIAALCHRRLGIGADGLMLIETHPTLDFSLEYFNSDGTQSLCGNGSRAAVVMASSLGMVNGQADFKAYDGPHHAELLSDGTIRLRMNDVAAVEREGADYLIYTGSPHLIRFVDRVKELDVYTEGRNVRFSERFRKEGINVNFVGKLRDNTLFIRTYERGVEDETLSCGTGITASALAASLEGYHSPVNIETLGGTLSVAFTAHPARQGVTFSDIYLSGPAKMVYEGELEL